MRANRRWLTSIGALLLAIALATSLAACGGDDGAASEVPTENNAATPIDGDDHEADDHEADTDDDDDDADTQAFAYLEAAPKDQLYLVEMTNFAYAPEVLEVAAGDVLEIAIQNVEAVLHDFTIDEIDADVHVSYLAGTGQHAHEESQLEADVHFALTEPGTGIVHMKIHEPGEYVFYCSVPGHRDAGMEGTLIVE
ncbi:MAG: multicopper oxidase domain-containing protein [Chloroflexi bacterium]|nr:multicopper oxidase domain-containing protein [Chloroflexota bacterium]